jgi:hypothetical protein
VKATKYRKTSKGFFFYLCIFTFLVITHTGCETDSAGVIDPSHNTPFIQNFTLSPERINTDTILVNGTLEPDDSLSIVWKIDAEVELRGADRPHLYYQLRDQNAASPVKEGVLKEIDNSPGSAIVEANMEFRTTRATVGTFSVTIYAETETGLLSNTMTRYSTVFRSNQPPVILEVTAPDTINTAVIGGGISIVMTAYVDDPDGVEDVTRVQTMNTQPDGMKVGPFLLERKEPGIFSISFNITPDAKKGTHRFEFVAFDRFSEESEVYIHIMEIQ